LEGGGGGGGERGGEGGGRESLSLTLSHPGAKGPLRLPVAGGGGRVVSVGLPVACLGPRP
jgi:hypothetical protein